MTVPCQHCSKDINEKVRHCPHCGSENIRTPTITVALCPRCNCELAINEYRGSTIDICPECQGLWLDSDEFAYHASARDTYVDQDIPRKFQRQPLEEKNEYLKCVRCDNVMNRKNFRKISGVLIDICGYHGVWLDAGELEQIRTFIANGGLDKSQDKEILANKDQISKVAREVRDLSTVFRTLNKFNLKRILLQGF